jgi:cold-inducible RNA-binding protein
MKNIFVGNLNSSTSEDALRKLFVAFGPVNRVKIMMDNYTGKSRGFGFVEMASAEDGDKAIVALNGTLLDERALNVNEARRRPERAGGNRGGGELCRSGERW